MNSKNLLYAAVVVLAVIAAVLLTKRSDVDVSPSASPTASGKVCTLEAKICPDGSAVGRVGPNCEFAPCPTPKKTATPRPTSMY